MPRQKDPNATAKKPPRLLAGCIGIPLLLIVGAAFLYFYHNRTPAIEIPIPTLPSPNAYDDFVKAGQLAKNMQHKSPYSMPGPPQQTCTLENFAAAAKDAEPALALLRQGLNKEYQVPPSRSNKDNRFPQFASLRELARTISGVSTYEERTGHPGQAMDTRLDGMELGVLMPHGGEILPLLLGIACEAIAESRIERLLPQLSAQELAHAADRLDRIAARRTPFAEIELEEGYSGTAQLLEMLKDRSEKGLGSFQSARHMIELDDNASLTWQQRTEIFRFLYSDKTAMLLTNLNYYKARAEEAKKPYTGKSAIPVPDNLLAQMTMPVTNTAQIDSLHCETVEAILRVEVALYRYKADHGRFPTTLAELTPTYLKAVPDDPFGGAANVSFRYQAKENGRTFLLYSIGQDLIDNGGQPQPNPLGPGDIVAGRLFTPSRY